jgi:serine kinase of HPr protein (carbohydrate metabolism regulator)
VAANIHASAVVLGDRCVLITGASGSGKSGLALALIAHMQGIGGFGRLVGDDQLLLSSHRGKLICAAPRTISGLVEIRGLGPSAVSFEPSAVVDLLVRLVDPGQAERFPEPASERLEGCELQCLRLASGDRDAAVLAILARLSLPPFG